MTPFDNYWTPYGPACAEHPASGSGDATVRLWDPVSGQPITTLTGHERWVWAVAFGQLPDGQVVLASGSGDATVRLWNPTRGRPITTLTGHEGTVWAVAFGRLPDGRVVLASPVFRTGTG